jgi:hypothetical protein
MSNQFNFIDMMSNTAKNVGSGLDAITPGLEAVNAATAYFNPVQWLGVLASKNTDYVQPGLDGKYNDQGYIERTVLDKLLGTNPLFIKGIQEEQIGQYLREDPTGRSLQRGMNNYGFKGKKDGGGYNRLDTLTENVGIGDARYGQLRDSNLLPGQLKLPNDSNFATVTKPVFDSALSKAKVRVKTLNDLVEAGVDPNSVSSRVEATEAIREKALKDEAERLRNSSEAIYGVKNPDGTVSGGTYEGEATRKRDAELLESSRSTREVNEGNLALNQTNSRNAQTQQDYRNKRDAWEYGDNKITQALERDWLLKRDAAQFAANAETIRLQNDFEMDRYDKMLENDAEVRRSESISDLVASLFMLGGTFGDII